MPRLCIRNWKKFQHFKDRRPPWIKLYRDLLDSHDWHNLDGESAKTLVMLWLLASETDDGTLPAIPTLAFRLRTTESRIKSILTKLSPWLIQDDITTISERYQLGPSETETETETEPPLPPKGKPSKLLYGEFQNVKLSDHELEKLETRFGKDDMWRRIESLSQYIASKGKQYKDFYATILQWAAREPAPPPPPPNEFAHLPTIDYPCWICGCRIYPPETCALKWHGMTADQYADGEWEHPREVTA